MFLFASRDFNQAFSRFQYFKQYSAFRKDQANKIILTQQNITSLIDTLENNRKQRQLVIDENKKIKIELEDEKQMKNSLFNNLEITNKNYLAEIRQKEKESKLIDNEIQKLIRLAISASNNNDSSVNNFALNTRRKNYFFKLLSNKRPITLAIGRRNNYKKSLGPNRIQL